MRPISASLAAAALVTLAAAPALADGPPISFTGCTEAVGLDVIPAAPARAMVPDDFVIVPADEAGELTVLIMRVVECEGIAVAGLPPTPGRFAHGGVSLANGDPTADANSFQLWFATDHRLLQLAMWLGGMPAAFDRDLTFDYTPDGQGAGTIDIDVSPNWGPAYGGSGTAFLYDIPRGPFIASWWAETRRGIAQARIVYGGVLFGETDLVTTTPAGSLIADLAGRTALGFAVLNTYNDFLTGELTFALNGE